MAGHVVLLGSVDDARKSALSAVDTLCELLDRLHDGGGGAAIYLPDTNALLHNVDLERWDFAGCDRFELVLGPSILVELDELKINHRKPRCAREGGGAHLSHQGLPRSRPAHSGCPAPQPTSTIKAIATEPRLDGSLPWLDPENRDDRFIATAIEAIRLHPRSPVTIVSRDINLQGKAELASLPCVEPPDPT